MINLTNGFSADCSQEEGNREFIIIVTPTGKSLHLDYAPHKTAEDLKFEISGKENIAEDN